MKKIILSLVLFVLITPFNFTHAALMPGSVVFANTIGKNTGQDNINFFWNDTLNFLGLGTNSPDSRLHVIGDAHITGNVLTNTLSVGEGTDMYPFAYDSGTDTLTLNDAGDAKNIRIKSDNDSDLFFIDGINDLSLIHI